MAGVRMSERKNQTAQKTAPKTLDYATIKEKFGKENMTIKEMIVFLQHTPQWEGIELSDKTVKNYIEFICSRSEGLLRPADFKEDPKKDKSPYCIRPECQGLLVTLMASGYFEGRKNDRRLKTRADLNRQLAENVNKYLSEDDKKIVLKNPSYVNAELEACLSKKINQELTVVLRTIYHVSPAIRYKLMMGLLEQLTNVRIWASEQDAKEIAGRLTYAHELDEIHDALYQKGLFSSKSLDELLVSLLALRMHDKEYTYITDDEELSPIGVYLATLIFDGDFPDQSAVKKQLDILNQSLEEYPLYQSLQEKAKSLFDLSNPFEEGMYRDLISLTKMRFCTPYVFPDEYERMVRFTESAIAEDKWDILNRFMNL